MKRRKILVLIPMLGLFLSGCTFQEGFATAKHWIGQNIYHPLKDWIDEMTGKKSDEKKDEGDGGSTEVAPTGVTLNHTSLELTTESEDVTLTATVAPERAKQEVEWSVAPEGVVTVSDAGVVHVEAAGDAVITAAAKADKTKKATCSVHVAAPGEPDRNWQILTAQPEATGSYRIALCRELTETNAGLWYVTGQTTKEASGGSSGADYYLATTEDVSEAAVVTVEAAEGGFKVKLGERYLAIIEDGTHINSVIKTSAEDATVLTYDLEFGFVKTFNEKTYGLGTNNTQTFTTIGAVDFTGHPENFKACLYEYKETPAATSVVVASKDEVNAGESIKLLSKVLPAGASQEVVWTIESGSEFASLEGNVLTGTAAGTVVVKATAKGTTVSQTKSITVNAALSGFSFSRSGSENSVTAGYEVVVTLGKANADNYQDKSGTEGMDIAVKKSSGTIWTTAPTTITLTVKVGGGSTRDSLVNNMTACLLDADGEEITASETVVTTKVEVTTGKDYEITLPASANVSGVKIKHTKESGYNIRLYGVTLVYE